MPAGARHARNDYGDYNYGGACPPPGHGTHRYIFTIHALDCEHLDLPEDTTTARVGFNVWAHSLGSASLTGTFSRAKSALKTKTLERVQIPLSRCASCSSPTGTSIARVAREGLIR